MGLLDGYLTNIANAIRTKKGTQAQINAQDFASEILSIAPNVDVLINDNASTVTTTKDYNVIFATCGGGNDNANAYSTIAFTNYGSATINVVFTNKRAYHGANACSYATNVPSGTTISLSCGPGTCGRCVIGLY